MGEHTPTPWKVSPRGYIQGPFADNSRGMQDIAGLVTVNNNHANTAANAAFIVKAVNSHAANEAKIEALVEALESWLEETEGTFPFASIEKSRAALSLAKGDA